jgi:hypothetical protein
LKAEKGFLRDRGSLRRHTSSNDFNSFTGALLLGTVALDRYRIGRGTGNS